jgi:hypothetical protein
MSPVPPDTGVQNTVGATTGEDHPLEIVMGFRVVGTALTFRVATGGCTKADDFRVDVEQSADRHVSVSLRRVRADTCKAFLPDGTEITFEAGPLGIPAGHLIVIRNPFASVVTLLPPSSSAGL